MNSPYNRHSHRFKNELLKINDMCIICDDQELGMTYLSAIDSARYNLKMAEDALLKLAKKHPVRNYDEAHKKLVRIRRSINEVEIIRSERK